MLDDLAARADRLFRRKRVYASAPSTIERIWELYHTIPAPTYSATPAAAVRRVQG